MHSDDSSHPDDESGEKVLILPLTTAKYNPDAIWICKVAPVIVFLNSVTN
jgi:hypothetical protein